MNGTNYKVTHCGPSHSQISSLLGPNIRLRILFSNTLSLHSSLNVRNYVPQPYSRAGNVIVLYILIFKLLERSREDKNVWREIDLFIYSLIVWLISMLRVSRSRLVEEKCSITCILLSWCRIPIPCRKYNNVVVWRRLLTLLTLWHKSPWRALTAL